MMISFLKWFFWSMYIIWCDSLRRFLYHFTELAEISDGTRARIQTMLCSETKRRRHNEWWRFSLLLLLCSPFLCFPIILSSSGWTLAMEVSDGSQKNNSLLAVQVKTITPIPGLHSPYPILCSSSTIPYLAFAIPRFLFLIPRPPLSPFPVLQLSFLFPSSRGSFAISHSAFSCSLLAAPPCMGY